MPKYFPNNINDHNSFKTLQLFPNDLLSNEEFNINCDKSSPLYKNINDLEIINKVKKLF
jgi:hypothetical protein